MTLATDAQKWKIVGMVRDMDRDANERSAHGKAIKAAARGFAFYAIRPDLTKEEASAFITLLNEAGEFFGSDADKLLAAANALTKIKVQGAR